MKCFRCGGMQMLRCEHTGGGIYWLCPRCNSTVESTSNSNEIVNNKAEDKYRDELKPSEEFKKSHRKGGGLMAKCKRCGYPIQPHYTYCKKCFYELGSPYETVLNNTNTHKCRKCGCEISGRYYYCSTCAKKLGFLD